MYFVTPHRTHSENDNSFTKAVYKPRPHFQIITNRDIKSSKTKNYVAEEFKKRYGARIEHFLPIFLQMASRENICGAVGIRPAGNEPLFLEQYLEKSAEHVVSEYFFQPVCRTRIVEIGNLVATQRGSSYLLFLVLAKILHAAGFHWMLFTATQQVERILLKMRFSPLFYAKPIPRAWRTPIKTGGPITSAGPG